MNIDTAIYLFFLFLTSLLEPLSNPSVTAEMTPLASCPLFEGKTLTELVAVSKIQLIKEKRSAFSKDKDFHNKRKKL